MTQIIPASDVSEGDTLASIGHGYVFENVSAPDAFVANGGGFYVALSDEDVAIGFHDALGNECYLIVPGDFELEVTS